MNDEGFREIQLNGKQLVFLFIAATVVSVVIFLFGVMVGRGVRGDADAVETAASDAASTTAAATAENRTPSSPAPNAAAGQAPAATPPPASELSYADRLLRNAPPEETLKASPVAAPEKTSASAPAIQEPVASPPMPAAQKPTAPATQKPTTSVTSSTIPKSATPVPETKPSETPAAAATAADPNGPGFAVQVAAYRDRKEADTLANQLLAKGYPAFVMEPAKGAPMPYFRVRVGKFKTRQDAEAVSAKLQKAEQLTNAWIAR